MVCYFNIFKIIHQNSLQSMSSLSNDGTSEESNTVAAKFCDADNQFVGTRHLGIINSKRHLDPSHLSRVKTGE